MACASVTANDASGRMTYHFDALILGAGAAGLMCAIEAGKRGKHIAILERAEQAGKRVLISGGGRCNFTNLYCQPENFVSGNPHFAKSALRPIYACRFHRSDREARHSLPRKELLGQLFCDRSAGDILEMLEAECRAAGVEIITMGRSIGSPGQPVYRLLRITEFRSPPWSSPLEACRFLKLAQLVHGYDLARQFGLKIQRRRDQRSFRWFSPTDDRANYCDLAGVSTEVLASVGAQKFREAMLVTHRGLSGPAILQVSTYWVEATPIRVDLAPGYELTNEILVANERNLTAARAAFGVRLPKRLATRWLDLHAPPNWSNASLMRLERAAHDWMVTPAGTEGYEKAEVTAGGVDTEELSSKTMESLRVPGLYFIGEVVDVTGQLGGFNFQWAWAVGSGCGPRTVRPRWAAV